LNNKPNILVFIDWFWPGYLAGGPVQSIVSLVSYLGNDFNFKIVTTNCDLNSKVGYKNIEPNKWIHSSLGCDVFYAEPKSLNSASIMKIMTSVDFDLVYINSFFSKNFSILPIRILKKNFKNKPFILAPRGMLGEGALAIKMLKKRLFILYSKLTGLHAEAIWHATSQQEEDEIKKIFRPKKFIAQISNLPKKMNIHYTTKKEIGKLNLCFISRISEKKNLTYALDVLSQVKTAEVHYNIYGPKEDDNYWKLCEDQIKQLPQNIVVMYKGTIMPNEIESVLGKEQMMLLPTLNENFGHSIVESLLCGCPVIISDQTPWNDLEINGAGYAISLDDKQKFISVIESCASLSQESFSEMSKKAINYISKKIDLELITQQYKTLFNESIKN
jgi:glycosyltransferase involved in cell wall biosynthesis